MHKKILILTPFYPPNIGGAETFVEGLVKEVSKCHEVTVLTFQPFQGKLERKTCQDMPGGTLTILRMGWIIPQGKAWKGTSIINLLSVLPQMLMNCLVLQLKERFDVIHAQGLIAGGVGVLVKKLVKVKVFITLLALYGFGKSDKAAWFVFKSCDRIFVEGENGKRDLEALQIDNRRIRLFQHWADQSVFFPPASRPNDKTRVLFIGRPIPEKGKHIIEEAERILNDPKRYEFKYVENISYQELPEIYRWADVVCVPSLYPEGFSRVVIESASCGCSLIVSNNGSLPEMVQDFGYVITPTPDNFALLISLYKRHENDIAYQYAKKEFSPKNAEVFTNEYSN